MKVFSLMILLSLTVLGLIGCSGAGSNTTGNTTNSNARTANSANNAMNSNTGMTNSNANMTNSNMNMSSSTGDETSPTGFMTKAAQGGMAEVELGRMASTKAQNADVKKFAQKMVQDHSNANTELKALAAKKNVTLPTELDPMHKSMSDDLSKLSGAEFDKEYVDGMVEDHEKTVALFQTQADKGTDADAKAWATKTLPNLKMHLQMIKDIQSKMK